jgi:AmiR/NasT family two-component response regulator
VPDKEKRVLRQRPRDSAAQSAHAATHLHADLSGLDIAVALRRDADGELLVRELQRTRARVRHCWPPPERLPEDADVIFMDLIPEMAARIPWIPGDANGALVVVAPHGMPPDLDLLKKSAADAILHRPIAAHAVAASLVQAVTMFSYCQRLRGRIEKLDETLRSFRSVERAKSIIMHRNQMDENAAYEFLRKRAMDRRTSINAVAAAIIDAHEIL